MEYVSSDNKGECIFCPGEDRSQDEQRLILCIGNLSIILMNRFPYINGHLLKVPDSMAVKCTRFVNSVHYFSVLPYGLNDKAVRKKLLQETSIKETPYYKVQITFTEDGGGEDFEDVFIYWIDKTTFKIDYLAYSFHVDGGGMRFREATNERVVNGIRFVDYNNYKAKNASTKLENLDKAFENNGLNKLSEINLENVSVKILN